jgi:hypothetical protein
MKICAVETEYVVACELLDEEHPPLALSSPHDQKSYTFGCIGSYRDGATSLIFDCLRLRIRPFQPRSCPAVLANTLRLTK